MIPIEKQPEGDQTVVQYGIRLADGTETWAPLGTSQVLLSIVGWTQRTIDVDTRMPAGRANSWPNFIAAYKRSLTAMGATSVTEPIRIKRIVTIIASRATELDQ